MIQAKWSGAALASMLLFGNGCIEQLVDFEIHRLIRLKVDRIHDDGFDMKVRCELKNPNPLGARLRNIRYQTYLGTHLVGSGAVSGPVQVAARSTFELEVPVRVPFDSLPVDMPRRLGTGRLPLQTRVFLSASTSVGTFEMRLISNDNVDISKVVSVAVQGQFQGDAVKIQGMRLVALKLKGVALVVRIRAKNRFAFPVRVRRGAFSISVNGSYFGKGVIRDPVTLPPRAAAVVTAEVAATHGAAFTAALDMLGADARYQLDGTLWIDPIGSLTKLPLKLEADASIFGK